MDTVENQKENIAHRHVLCGCCGVNFCPCKPCVWWLKLLIVFLPAMLIIIFLPAILVPGKLALILGFAIAALLILVVCGMFAAKNLSKCCKDSGKPAQAAEFSNLNLFLRIVRNSFFYDLC